MITSNTKSNKLNLATALVLLFSVFAAFPAMAVDIPIGKGTTYLSNLKSPAYSGDAVAGSTTGEKYPGAAENITIAGSTGYKTDAILVVDRNAEIGTLQLSDGSNRAGVVEIQDGYTLTVGILNAVNPNNTAKYASEIKATGTNQTGQLKVLYNIAGIYYTTNKSGVVIPPTPLPVEFISFTAAKEGAAMAMLNFSTAWEVNNAGFEVERSTNGISWNMIGFVPGHGNTSEIKNYAFATSLANINSAVVYYRLKQVDFNGQFEYSATRTIRLSAAAAKAASVYPNPATNKISVSLDGVAAGEMAKIAVMDMSGKIIISANQMVEEGNFSIDMNIDNLTKGNYIINVSSPSANFNTKLVKF